MNKAELVAAVKLYANRPNLDDKEVNLLIQTVEGELNKELREHPRNVKRASVPMPENNGILPLPDDMAGLIRVFDDDGVYEQYPVVAAPGTEDCSSYNDRGYINRGTVLELFPHPETGAIVYADYHAYLDPLVGSTDVNWLSIYHGDVYLYGCLREIAVYVKDDARLKAWRGEFDRRVDALRQQGWNQNFAAASRVRIR